MGVYYTGNVADLTQEEKAEIEGFIQQGIPMNGTCCPCVVTLGTRQADGVRLTVIGLLRGSGLEEVFMQCNRQSQKVTNLLACDHAEIAISNGRGSLVLNCTGEISDSETLKREKWEDWMAQYHPKGCTSPDYVVLRFAPQNIRAML